MNGYAEHIQVSGPTVVAIPDISGAPWNLNILVPLACRPLHTMRLPEGVASLQRYADYVAGEVAGFDSYVLVGDSFGALIALALAIRQPKGLMALVVSSAAARAPVRNPARYGLLRLASMLPEPMYQMVSLRLHAALVASPFDDSGQVPWSSHYTYKLLREYTPHKSYAARLKAALEVDLLGALPAIGVPTLLITPEHDGFVDAEASQELAQRLPHALEVKLPATGHLMRYTHPATYAETIDLFLAGCLADEVETAPIKKVRAGSTPVQIYRVY